MKKTREEIRTDMERLWKGSHGVQPYISMLVDYIDALQSTAPPPEKPKDAPRLVEIKPGYWVTPQSVSRVYASTEDPRLGHESYVDVDGRPVFVGTFPTRSEAEDVVNSIVRRLMEATR